MVSKLFTALKNPVRAYFDLTLAEPCRLLAERSKRSATKQIPSREPRPHFSLAALIKKQREMTSPNVRGPECVGSVTKFYIRPAEPTGASPRYLH